MPLVLEEFSHWKRQAQSQLDGIQGKIKETLGPQELCGLRERAGSCLLDGANVTMISELILEG